MSRMREGVYHPQLPRTSHSGNQGLWEPHVESLINQNSSQGGQDDATPETMPPPYRGAKRAGVGVGGAVTLEKCRKIHSCHCVPEELSLRGTLDIYVAVALELETQDGEKQQRLILAEG